jgi:hypothetical protein
MVPSPIYAVPRDLQKRVKKPYWSKSYLEILGSRSYGKFGPKRRNPKLPHFLADPVHPLITVTVTKLVRFWFGVRYKEKQTSSEEGM